MTISAKREESSTLAERYDLGQLLGCGGSGRVCRARQRSTGQEVAVKLLELSTGLSPRDRSRRKERFRREMAICGKLAHPDIVKLIDFGDCGDSLYSVLELVNGRTLADVIQSEGSLQLARAQTLLRQLLGVLVYSHAMGVTHRDLKPSNVMVLGELTQERIKVLDFGVSVMASGAANTITRMTLSHELVGTPAYAAPEQLRGDTPTSKTDLYGWGLILLECLTGKNVMSGASLGEIFQRQLSPEPVPIPPSVRKHPLGTLLRWVLEKDPARRAPSAADVLSRLDRLDFDGLVDASGFLADGTARRPSYNVQQAGEAETKVAESAVVEGERRQVTALCCRLPFRSSTVSDPLLLEAYRADLFTLCRATVEEFGGTYIAGLGDSVLFCFGLPRAKDTDARMAMHATLELSAKVRVRSAALRAQSQMELVLQAGLHTGLVTVGERQQEGAFEHGLVATLASALAMQSDSPGEASIVVSDAFRRVVGRQGEFVERGPHINAPWQHDSIPTHQLLGESLVELFAQGVAPMVGRDDDLARIVSAWRDSHQGGRVVLIRGEPGMGKSRLAYEFGKVAKNQGHDFLTLRFSPESSNVALRSLLELVLEELGLKDGSPLTCSRLSAALSGFDVDRRTAVPLLCTWLSVMLSEDIAPLPNSPQMQRAMLYELLATIVLRILERGTRYLLVEDLHWADPSSRDWLACYIRHLCSVSGFVLATSRPGAGDLESSEAGTLVIELSHLSDEQVRAMVAELPSAAQLPPAVVAKIVERADGVPLFAEELARALAEHGSVSEIGEVPATLRDLLMSRLDQLGPAKDTAQFAAAIGREFDFDLLSASAAKDEATLLADLAQLVNSGLVLSRRWIERPAYIFRHALLRDSAYGSMMEAGKRSVHNAIADALLDGFSERVEARPDLAALHLELAGRPAESQTYWLASGRKAMGDAAYDDALVNFARGLKVVAACPATADRDDAELVHLSALLAANVVKYGFGAPELPRILKHAQVCIRDGRPSPVHTLPVLWGRYLFNTVRPNFREALPIAQQLLEVAASVDDRSFMLVGHSALIRCFCWMGDFERVDAHYAAIGELYDPAKLKQLMELTGEDPYMAAASFAALALIVRGKDRAGMEILNGLIEDERIRIPGVAEGTWAQLAFGYVLRGMNDPGGPDLNAARKYGEMARDSALRLGFPFWAGYGSLMEASARVYQGDPTAVDEVQRAMEMFRAAGATIGFGWNYVTLAFGLSQRGELDAASEALDSARAHLDHSGEGFFAAEQHRIEARLLRARSPRDAAAIARELELAAQIGRSQGAGLFVERAENELSL